MADIRVIGFDWDLIWHGGYDGLGKRGYMHKSMRANEKQGIIDPKMNGPNDTLQLLLLTQGIRVGFPRYLPIVPTHGGEQQWLPAVCSCGMTIVEPVA